MRRILLLSITLLSLAGCATTSHSYRWNKIPADGHLTGVTAPNASNTVEALGVSDGSTYASPSGKVYNGGVTPQAAKLLIDVQPQMADLKQVIGYCPEGMVKGKPESTLSNWAVDILMDGVSKATGEKVDVGIINFGGIRCDMPQGEVLMDDIVSMFPFKNYGVLVTLTGKRLMEIFTHMAEKRIEAVGGATIVMKDHKLVSATVGGQPVDENAIYHLATIDFLLDGGDGHDFGQRVESVQNTGILMVDFILPRVLELQSEGKPIEYHMDGRVTTAKD